MCLFFFFFNSPMGAADTDVSHTTRRGDTSSSKTLKSSFSPQKRPCHAPQRQTLNSCSDIWNRWGRFCCRRYSVTSLTHCRLHCVWGWWSGLSGRLELCADMSLRINQAYQSDRCLSTCYKHLPRLAPTPSPHRLFIRLQPLYSGPVYSLAVALISGQRSATDLLN